MKKILTTTLLLMFIAFVAVGCGKKEEKVVNCEELDTTQCAEYEEQCKVCLDFINSPYTNCHPVAFCRNFDNLDANNQ